VDLSDPTDAALLCAEALDRAQLGFALYGGLVLAAYGEPRETRDVDVAVTELSAEAARRALEASGVRGIVAFDDVVFGGVLVGRVSLLGGDEHLGLNVLDLVRPRSRRYGAVVLERAVASDMRGRTIRVVTAEDFVILKALATRDRDLDDAASVIRQSGDVMDFAQAARDVQALALEIPDWDVRSRWDEILVRGGRRP
jgi:predicted nucleotidyltransferase